MGDNDNTFEVKNRDNYSLVRNTGSHPVIGYSFMLRVEGVYDLPCRAVRGFQKENEFEYIQEGGMNDYVHIKRKPISKPFTFKVERYVGIDLIDPLPLGSEPVLPIILFVNACAFPSLKPVRTYTFSGCTVIAKDYGELDAEKSGLVVETTTIAYREMVCVAVPTDTLNLGENGMNKVTSKASGGNSAVIGYAERPAQEKKTTNRKESKIKAATEKTWSKSKPQNAVAAKPAKEKTDTLESRKEAAAEERWSKKNHVKLPPVSELRLSQNTLARKKKEAAANTWKKKSHAKLLEQPGVYVNRSFMQKWLDILMGRKKKKPGKQDGSEYVKKPQREGEPGYSRPEMVKKAENSKWSKQTHAVLPKKEAVKTESLQGKKTSAESSTWSKKTHAVLPEKETAKTESLQGRKTSAESNTWSKKTHAVLPEKETAKTESLQGRKTSAESNTWSKKTHAVLPEKETAKTESLQGRKTSAEKNTWDNKSNAKIPETKSLSGMIEFSSKNTWPKKSYAVTIQKKLEEEKESKK